jgi:hypothetical protein
MHWASVRSYEEKVKDCNRFGFSGRTGVLLKSVTLNFSQFVAAQKPVK